MQELSQNAGEGGAVLKLPLTFFGENTDEDKSSQLDSNEYEVLTTSDISSKIIKIIDDSKKYCLIVTPYLKSWHHLQTYLKTASDKKKRILFFFRDKQDDNGNTEIKKFYNKFNFDIVFIKDLHAKIYLNEKEALITSMNLYDTSQQKNFEMGVFLKNKEIIDKYIKTYIVEQIFNIGKVDSLTLKGNCSKFLENYLFFEEDIDYCVYCGNPKKQVTNSKDTQLRYCDKCHKELKVFDKNNFRFCITCGKESKGHLQCAECYEKEK